MVDLLSLLYICLYQWDFSFCYFHIYSCDLFFFTWRILFNISVKAGLMLLKSFSYCLFVKLLISPSNLNESLAGDNILGCRFFPFITLNILCHFFLPCGISAENSAPIIVKVPLLITCCFSLTALIFSICNFCYFIFFNIYLFIYYFYLVALGLSCGRRAP